MTVRVPSLVLVLLVTSALGLVARLGFGAPAAAQTQVEAPRTAICKVDLVGSLNVTKTTTDVQNWMTQQIALGRTQFIDVPVSGVINLCAW